MKRFYLPIIALAAATMAFSSCKKENPESENGIRINGVLWAECNVDAFGTFADKAEDFGSYYQWNRSKAWPVNADVTGWDSSNETGEAWDEANDPCPAGWRIPTKEQQASLFDDDRVASEWTTLNGVNGYEFTDKSSGGSIFLAATGWRFLFSGELGDDGGAGYYWSGSSDSAVSAWVLYFYSDESHQRYPLIKDEYGRNSGYSVRCVHL